MTQTLKTSERLGVVDALRGFALLAIVLLHNLEHYNVAISHAAKKLVRLIFAMEKSGKAYLPTA